MNPKVKRGDSIIMTQSCNGTTAYEGIPLTVLSLSGGNALVSTNTGQKFTVFNTSPADVYVFATKESRIDSLKNTIEETTKNLKDLRLELEHLEKYETEEDFVAEKLEKILTAHNEGKSAITRTNAIAEVLKELKKSSLL